jgi:hypothetical protein
MRQEFPPLVGYLRLRTSGVADQSHPRKVSNQPQRHCDACPLSPVHLDAPRDIVRLHMDAPILNEVGSLWCRPVWLS